MIKRLLKKRWGFISIEIVIIAAIVLVSGFTAVGSFVEDGQKAANDAASKIDETLNLAGGGLSGEFPGGSNQTPGIPITDKLEGDGQEFHKLAPTTLTFRSEADFADFQEVQIDGETVDPAYYTVSEGSTIVTLYIDYLKTLNANEHTISIVSKTAAPTATFNVIEPEENSYGFYYNQPYVAYMSGWGGNVAFFIREDGTYDVINGFEAVSSGEYIATKNTITAYDPNLGQMHCTVSEDGIEIYIDELFTTFKLGDESIVADEDYIYVYDSSLDGYVVHAIDETQASYSPIKTGINGIPTVAIGSFAFQDCLSLTGITIPASVETIERYAFYNCSSLENIIIPASVETIEDHAFYGCESLTDVYYAGTETEWNLIDFGIYNDYLKNATIHFESTGPSN